MIFLLFLLCIIFMILGLFASIIPYKVPISENKRILLGAKKPNKLF